MSQIKLIVASILLCGALACSGSGSPPSTSAPQKATVRVGYLRLLSATPLYTALREGYFERENLNVQARVIKSGPEGNEALAAGNIDVAFSIVPSLLIANARGVPSDLVSIYGATTDGPQVRDHRIVVKPGSPIRTAADLRGRKVAVVGWPGPTSDVLELLSYLQRQGLSSKDVTLVGMPHQDMSSAIASGAIDAGALAEPYITMGVLGGTVSLLSEAEGYYYDPVAETEVTTYLARRSWIEANQDVAGRFIKALAAGRTKSEDRAWLIEHGLPTFNANTQPPIDFVAITVAQARGLRFMPIKPTVTLQGMQRIGEQLVRFGFLPTAPATLPDLIWRKR